MAAWSDIAENKLIDWFFRGQAIGLAGATAAAGTGPATLYVGLMTGAPGDTGPGAEISGNNYARVPITSSMANWAGTQSPGSTTASSGTGGTTSNNNVVTFNTPSANWGLVPYSGIFDSLSGGALLIYGTLTIPKTINNGDLITFPAGTLAFQVDN